jgi:hypothetical protein
MQPDARHEGMRWLEREETLDMADRVLALMREKLDEE